MAAKGAFHMSRIVRKRFTGKRGLAVLLVALLLVIVGVSAAVAATQGWMSKQTADRILYNGQVVTVNDDVIDVIKSKSYEVEPMTAPFPILEKAAVAIKDGKIIAVTDNKSVMQLKGKDTEVINLQGKVVIPGLQDSHVHGRTLGWDLANAIELTYAETKEDIVDLVADWIAEHNLGAGDWIEGRRWDEYKYPEMVTRWDLDAVTTGGQYVWLVRVYKGTVVNTAVFRDKMGIEDDDPSTWPSWWLTDPADFTYEDIIFRAPRTVGGVTYEVPTGVFVGSKANALIPTSARPPARSFEDDVLSIKNGFVDGWFPLGVVSWIDPGSGMGAGIKIEQEAYNRGWIVGRIPQIQEGTFYTESPEWIRNHLASMFINNLGDDHWRVEGTKWYADGGVGTRSAWLSEPFEDWETIEGAPNYGVPVNPDYANREAQYREAVKLGWSLHTHSCGDQAMHQDMTAYKNIIDDIKAGLVQPYAGRMAAGIPLDLRWTIIHAYLPIEPATYVIDDMADYGVLAMTNPNFLWQLGDSFLANVGPERAARLMPFKSYFEHGVIMTAGSDYGVCHFDPWESVYAMLTRTTQADKEQLGSEERTGIAEALIALTINGAYATFDEDKRGSIEVGKIADLVVLDLQDIFELERNPELCFEMKDRVVMTMVDGETVFEQ